MNEAQTIQQMNAELKRAASMKDIFEILEKYYDLKNCKPGDITKAGLIMKLQQGVKAVGAKLKINSNGEAKKKGYSFNW